MKVTFWGTRGSLPAPMNWRTVRAKVVNALVKGGGRAFGDATEAEAFCDSDLAFHEWGAYGGNTACVEIGVGEGEFLICDLGSGAREFSLSALGRRAGKPAIYHVLLSHVHWDHIMGFPFFVPAFIPGNVIRIYSCHAHAEFAIRGQNRAPCFPVEFEALGAKVEFVTLQPDTGYEIAGLKVTGHAQLHGGDSYGYRIEAGDRSVVYATDAEYKPENQEQMQDSAAFFKGADMVIFDAMYSLAESMSVKEDWGHSSNILGVELCHMGEVSTLCLFHHEPVNSDAVISDILEETVRYEAMTRKGRPLKVVAAYDGLQIDV